jgi:hypothetical protein
MASCNVHKEQRENNPYKQDIGRDKQRGKGECKRSKRGGEKVTVAPTISIILLYQLGPAGLDPTPWTAWGVLGLLGLVVVILMGIIWKLFTKQTSTMEARDQILMSFVDRHRSETSKAINDVSDKSNQAMKDVANTVAASQDKMVSAFAKMARVIDELVLLERIYDRASKKAGGGTPLTEEEVEKIVRIVRSSNRDSSQ